MTSGKNEKLRMVMYKGWLIISLHIQWMEFTHRGFILAYFSDDERYHGSYASTWIHK